MQHRVLDNITYCITTFTMLERYATKLCQERLAECIEPRHPRIVRYKFHTLTIGKMPDLFYRYMNSSWNAKNSWRSSRMIYYGLLDKTFTSEGQIACVPGRSVMVKFYVYTTGKVIFVLNQLYDDLIVFSATSSHGMR